MNKSLSGVYILIIKAPTKTYKYIGQSIQINKRISQHKTALKFNRHYSTYMQNAYNKYNNVEFKIQYCEKEFITILEQVWISIVQCEKDSVCLNQQAAERKNRAKLSEQTKAKISKALKGNPQKAKKSNHKDKDHHNYIHNIYSFTNINTLEVFVGTRKDFMHKINLHWNNCARLTDLIKNRCKVCKQWTLTSNLDIYSLDVLKQASNKTRLYIFTKENTEQFIGTVSEFSKMYSIPRWKVKTHKYILEKGIDDWRVRPLEV